MSTNKKERKERTTLAKKVSSKLALRGHSVRSWAASKQLSVKTVYAVLDGKRSGKRSPEVTKAIGELRSA